MDGGMGEFEEFATYGELGYTLTVIRHLWRVVGKFGKFVDKIA